MSRLVTCLVLDKTIPVPDKKSRAMTRIGKYRRKSTDSFTGALPELIITSGYQGDATKMLYAKIP